MKKALLIAEKPSLMRDIQSVYGKHKNELSYTIDFTAQRGHLMTLKLPDELDPAMKNRYSWDNLPFFPEEHGGWQYRILQEKKQGHYLTAEERYRQIEEMVNNGNYDFIIHAGDPDQEGELLINIVLASFQKQLPVARFWTNDLTESHILEALKHLRNDRTDERLIHLLQAAYVRQRSDYLFGMNITRAASMQMRGRAACGRVKTFIQTCVVQREDAIASFTPHTVYGVKASYTAGGSGVLCNGEVSEEDETKGVRWFETKEKAEEVIAAMPQDLRVESYEKKHTRAFSPKLFKLSSVQMTAGKRGYKPDETLNIIQSLYEKHKVMSYPRTSCEYMGSNEDFSGILHALHSVEELAPFIRTITKEDIERVRKSKKWINDKELESKGHSALRPTTTKPDFSKMTAQEKEIYLLIAKRFVAMFLQPWEQDVVTMTTKGNGCVFRSNGKVTTQKGYLTIFDQNPEDSYVPDVKPGDTLSVQTYETTQKTSQCPSHLTEADLIAICENPAVYLDDQRLRSLGKRLIIGTEATRATIIRQLIDKDKYLEEFTLGKKEYVRATPSGTAMIRNLEGLLITKPDMTGEWEVGLEQVREGTMTSEELEKTIRDNMITMMEEIKGKRMLGIRHLGSYLKTPCPFCGKQVLAGERGIACVGYKVNDPTGCTFALSRTIAGVTFEDSEIEMLCRKGKTPVKTFLSKKNGEKYKAMLECREDGTIRFAFPSNETAFVCPKCGKPLVKAKKGYLCADYGKGCKYAVWYEIAGKKVSDKDMRMLLKEGKTDWIKGFKKADGHTFSAKLVLDENGAVGFSFEHSRTSSDDIKETLDYYNSHAKEYAERTGTLDTHALCDRFLSFVPEAGHILDLGCGSGRDSLYFLGKGYSVDAVDGSTVMCEIASERTGLKVKQRRIEKYSAKIPYDGIFANMSLVHIPEDTLPDVLKRLAGSIKDGGVLYMSLGYGKDSGMKDGRWLTYLDEKCFKKAVRKSRLEVKEQWTVETNTVSMPEVMHIILEKPVSETKEEADETDIGKEESNDQM